MKLGFLEFLIEKLFLFFRHIVDIKLMIGAGLDLLTTFIIY